MPIAPRMRMLSEQLELVRQRQSLGKTQLTQLKELNLQVAALLQEARDTHFESPLRCIQGLVHSLETLADQKARLASLATTTRHLTAPSVSQSVA